MPELLGEPDEKSFGAADIAEPIRVFVLHHFADELRAVLAKPGKRLVDVVHSEHDAQVAESVHRGVPVIGNCGRGEKSRELEPTVAVGGDASWRSRRALGASPVTRPAQSPSIVARPSSFEAKLGEKRDGGIEGFYHDADVVHPLESHITSSHFSSFRPSHSAERPIPNVADILSVFRLVHGAVRNVRMSFISRSP